MALWAQAQQLPESSLQQIRSIYGEHFPIEIRHTLAPWIEEKFLIDTEIVGDNPQHEQYVTSTISSLFNEIETKANSFTSPEFFLTRIKLADAARSLQLRYSSNPMMLFNYIRRCLQTESQIILRANGETSIGVPPMLMSNSGVEILQQLEILRHRTQETGEKVRSMENEQEAFALHYHECTKINAQIQELQNQQQTQQVTSHLQQLQLRKTNMEMQLSEKIAHLVQVRMALIDELKKTVQQLGKVQSMVLDDELIRWKREQQLAGNGAAFNGNLDTIQEWCECLAELIWITRQHLKDIERLKQKLNLESPGGTDILPQLLSEVTQILSALVTSTFIIEKQPPQVMKTNTRFTATVRLLVGGKLNVNMTPPQVKVTIISEAQANVLLKNDKLAKSGEASGEILNNTGTMEYQQASRQLSVSFRNMQLKKIKRAEKKGTESVMDEKFSLFFQSQFSVGGGELMFQVWTLSLPVVVIVHGNQEPHAWATVTWDNAFSEPGRPPFAVPDKVPWNKVAEMLSLKFRSATGRPLTEENLRFLADKAFRGSFTDNNQLLSWSQFCKEPLSERNFTFWEWFYAVMKLTREHLKGPWVEGLILGFVRKKDAEEMLQRLTTGTFLLRFSDSELGGVTIAWVSENSEVFMIQPFTSKDFAIRSLADRIKDLQHLSYLYPETCKEGAFMKYYTPDNHQVASTNGYVKPSLITQVPPMYTGYQNTPQHSFMQSPDPSRDTPSVVSSYAGDSTMGPPSQPSVHNYDYLCGLEDYDDMLWRNEVQ